MAPPAAQGPACECIAKGRVPIAPEHYNLLARAIRASLVAAMLCIADIVLSLSRGQVKR